MASAKIEIWTVGHSNRTIAEFVELLRLNQIGAVADVRRFPGSRRYPQFNERQLAATLAGLGIDYFHLPELGGRRKPRPDSPNSVWRHEAFRGYADHMSSDEFRSGISRLLEIARAKRTTLMCAEALWWHCHRALIADYLKSIGLTVCHIISAGKTETHPYTSAATIVDGKLSYAGASAQTHLNLHQERVA